MRRSCVFRVLLVLSVLAFVALVGRPKSGEATGAQRNVALLRMELPRGFHSNERVALANAFVAALHRTEKFEIVDREDMSAILEELKFQASDLADERKVVKLGGLVGVDLFAVCDVKSIEGIYHITARLISVETARVEKIATRRCQAKIDFLAAMFNEIAFDLAGEEEGKGRLLIETDPPGAEVFLFGVSVGASPLTLRLAPGAYLLSVEKRGYGERRKPLHVEAGQETSWKIELVKTKGFRLGDYIGGRGFWSKD